jgi:DNA-3-methyladenine glycosylase
MASGAAVLIRAVMPTHGVEFMRQRRNSTMLCSGPGRLTEALGIRPEDDGAAYDGTDFSIILTMERQKLLVGRRIGIRRAQDLTWRFGLFGATGFSRPFPKDVSVALSEHCS